MRDALRSALEERVVGAVRDGRDELVALVSDLVAFDTTARNVGDPPRQEAELQDVPAAPARHRRRRGRRLGAGADRGRATGSCRTGWTSSGGRSSPRTWAAREAAARCCSTATSTPSRPSPSSQWIEPPAQARGPRRPAVRPRQLRHEGRHRRHALRPRDVAPARRAPGRRRRLLHQHRRRVERRRLLRLRRARRPCRRGPLRRADGFDAWVACRGGVNPDRPHAGRTGHAEMHHPHWRDGGPVNAIEKMAVVLDADPRPARGLGAAATTTCTPTCTPRTSCRPSSRAASGWSPILPPARRRSRCSICRAGSTRRHGQAVFDEVEAFIAAAAAKDGWLAEHPLNGRGPATSSPPRSPTTTRSSRRRSTPPAGLGRAGKISGLDSWHDAAVFTRVGDTPTISFGPGDIAGAHTIDESVPVDDLVDHAAAVALVLMRWCGVA